MVIKDRQKIYQRIEDYRKRPLIVYATSTRSGASAQMAGDVVREFIDQIDKIGKDVAEVDVLIHSNGGDGLAAWKLMATLRQYYKDITVLVPDSAMSAATLFCLGADRIYMHRNASLGPIDPQITVSSPDGNHRNFAYEDVSAFLRFLEKEIKVTEQASVTPIVAQLFNVVDPISIGAAKRASELSSSIGERLLLTHMDKETEGALAREIAQNLNNSFFAHGDTLSRQRATELRLKIMDTDPALESLIWEAYLGLESYMELKSKFDPVQHFLKNDLGAKSLTPTAPLAIPPNCPPQIAGQAWEAHFQNALNIAANKPAVVVKYTLILGVVESIRHASEYRLVGDLTAGRTPNGQIQCSGITTESDWRIIAG